MLNHLENRSRRVSINSSCSTLEEIIADIPERYFLFREHIFLSNYAGFFTPSALT